MVCVPTASVDRAQIIYVTESASSVVLKETMGRFTVCSVVVVVVAVVTVASVVYLLLLLLFLERYLH